MDISEIKVFLKQRGQACLFDFTSHYKIETEEIHTLLEACVKEGKVRKRILSSCCNSGCTECLTDVYEFYEWLK